MPHKILECLIYACLDLVINPELPKELVGFCRGRSTTDQVTFLAKDITDAFQAGEKAGIILLDHMAVYDVVWLRELHLKVMIPDCYLLGFIMEMLSNCSFTLHTSYGQHSRLRQLVNAVPQCSVLLPMLFNIYIHDIPATQANCMDTQTTCSPVRTGRP